jgi:hypothetical protein
MSCVGSAAAPSIGPRRSPRSTRACPSSWPSSHPNCSQNAVWAQCARRNCSSPVATPAEWRRKRPSPALAGTSPIDASSGRQQRHRLNRGGDRQLNCALHVIALQRHPPPRPDRRLRPQAPRWPPAGVHLKRRATCRHPPLADGATNCYGERISSKLKLTLSRRWALLLVPPTVDAVRAVHALDPTRWRPARRAPAGHWLRG